MVRTCALAALIVLGVSSVDAAHAQTRLHGLIVLIDFEDAPGTIPIGRAHDIINGEGYTEPGVTKSLRDYYYAQSRGNVVLTHDIVGYYRAPEPTSWYNEQTFEAFIALTRQALDWVVDTNPTYDWNGLSRAIGPLNRRDGEDGSFLSVLFLSTAPIPGVGGTHWLTGWAAPNGVEPRQIVGAMLKKPWDANPDLFVIAHEVGHTIWGWPDTYDYTDLSFGTGLYTVMSGSGSDYTGDVEPVGAPFLLREGWTRAVEIRRQQTIVMEPDGGTVAFYRNPLEPREYFVIEARMRSTTGNSIFPRERGLVIWHVDERVTTANTGRQMTFEEHYAISVEQADGSFDLERRANRGDPGDVFIPGATFSPWVSPNSNWWDGTPSGLTIDDIRFLPNGRIMFRASVR